ncbi:hypothetical protein [Streptomyces sp. NPDC056543]|uniref:hypothetical protein n=1 Tax=unclassified Streptomyces TaxID=2593676 RepID=UPI0036779C7E
MNSEPTGTEAGLRQPVLDLRDDQIGVWQPGGDRDRVGDVGLGAGLHPAAGVVPVLDAAGRTGALALNGNGRGALLQAPLWDLA